MSRFPIWALVLAACGSEGTASEDAGRPDLGIEVVDAGVDLDLGSEDATALDAGTVDLGPPDTGSTDAGLVDAGDAGPEPFGTLSGACGVLDDELTGGAASFYGALDFGADGYLSTDEARLSEGAKEILSEGTAGGSSELSEAFSFEVLHRCEGARLLWSETEVEYVPTDSKKTDHVVEIAGEIIGVSVTRAVGFPRNDPWPVSRALTLLEDKLADIWVSSANVVPAQAWRKQILHVFAYEERHAEALRTAETMISAEVRGDTLLWVTVTDGEDAALY